MDIRTRFLSVIGGTAVAAAVAISGVGASPASPSPHASASAASAGRSDAGAAAQHVFAGLERSHGATLGVAAIDTRTGRIVSYRGGERFPFASSNKTFIAAATLQASSAADLDVVVHYTAADLLAYAPITSRFVDTGMTVRELIDAMLRFSDNTAANLLVARLGGPDAVERWLRGIGDRTTNVDRVEPDLNEATPADPRDTTTPVQFAADLRKVLLGTSLDVADRTLLRNTMLDCTTGDTTIRAGVDPAWPVADKTGTGEYGVRDDIAVVYPTGRAPIVIVTMSRKGQPDAAPDNALLAEATKVAVAALR
ncbi:class A beta-lactamase [Leifsonia sp. NPDC080035]|uniref:Class A beta-lactamase n=1 Tax=Leifsonia sp. NPDC080035 TaxID=3143936 RepID=A0AAU7GFS9_9MICO